MYTFFPIYVPTLSTLWLPYLKMFVVIGQNLPKCDKLCSIFAQIMSLLCPNNVENFFRICPKSVQKLSNFCSKYVQNLLKISPTSHWFMWKICSKLYFIKFGKFCLSTVNMCWKICLKYVIKLSMFCSKCVLKSDQCLLICAQKYAQNI